MKRNKLFTLDVPLDVSDFIDPVLFKDLAKGEEEILAVASARVTPGDPGRLSGPPEDCYPPEPSEIEDIRLYYQPLINSKCIYEALTDKTKEKISDQLSELGDNYEPDYPTDEDTE